MQKRLNKTTVREDGQESGAPGSPAQAKKGEELKSEIDDILDEIESVLEVNAQAFVKQYVQDGGQ